MDRRSWLWRKKSSEKSPGETESSGSISSHSERYSDDQEISRASPNHSSQSPEVTSKAAVTNEDVNESLKILREKLSAALINISAKEDLVKQHSKVAEEAVAGWEKAENEGAALKLQLEAAAQKNLALEDRLGHLDGALKECLRKLRQAREEQEQKIHEAVVKNTRELETTKSELEKQLVELQTRVEATEAGDVSTANSDILLKLEAAEKKNSALQLELLARVEELDMRTLERDLSTETAESASKQHLESIKKVARLEAECRKLKALGRKASSANDHKSITASLAYIESLTDSHSDSGERSLSLEADNCRNSSVELNGYEPHHSDSWASALIAELDQFKNEKTITKNLTTSSVEIDLMDDFLEMERLAGLPQTKSEKHGGELERHNCVTCQHKVKLETMIKRTTELEKKLEQTEMEKEILEVALAESQEQLKTSHSQLMESEEILEELHRQLDFTRVSKEAYVDEIRVAILEKEAVESQLIVMESEVQALHVKVSSLETEVKEERALSAEITTKCQKLEDELSTKKRECQKLEDELSTKKRESELRKAAISNGESKIKQEKELAVAASQLAECQKTIASLGQQLKSLATLEDFMIDSAHPLELSEGSIVPRNGGLLNSPSSNNYVNKGKTDPLKTASTEGSPLALNGDNRASPQSSSSSSSTTSTSSVNRAVTSEKSRNGFGKLFSRSKGSMRLENP